MMPWMATPRMLPTWTRPDNVFSSRMTKVFPSRGFRVSRMVRDAVGPKHSLIVSRYFFYAVGLLAVWRFKGELFAFLLAHERRAKRRDVGKLARAHIRLFASDDSVLVNIGGPIFFDGNLGTKTNNVFFLMVSLYRRMLDEFFKLPDALFGRGLQFARLLIFGIFGKIAERTGIFEILRDLGAPYRLQVLELFRHLIKLLLGNNGLLVGHGIET